MWWGGGVSDPPACCHGALGVGVVGGEGGSAPPRCCVNLRISPSPHLLSIGTGCNSVQGGALAGYLCPGVELRLGIRRPVNCFLPYRGSVRTTAGS